VGFLAAWLIFRSDGTCRIDDASLSQGAQGLQRVTQEMTTPPEPPNLERPDSRVLALTERPSLPAPTQVSPPSEPPTPPAIAAPDPRDLPETTLDEMIKKRQAIGKALGEKANPILDQRFDDNLAVRVSDQKLIYAVKMTHDGTWRTELPRAGYNDLYALKDETLRLDKLIDEAQRKAAEEKKPQ
jgi:hypothetical protein